MAAGSLIWEHGAVRHVEGSIYEVLRGDRSLARVDVTAVRQPCHVPSCRHLANPCKHYYAADLFLCNGAFADWKAKGTVEQQDPEPATDSESSSDDESGTSSDEDAPATDAPRFSAALALQASVAYTQRGSTAGLAVKWPTASGQSTQTNFQLGKRLASQSLPTEPPAKRAGRCRDPVKGPEAPPELLAPKFDWADAVGAILPTIIGLAYASRLKDPLPDVFQTAINKFPDTLASIYNWWYLGAPLASAEIVLLRDLFADRTMRAIGAHGTPSLMAAVGLISPGDNHRNVEIESDCCSFSHAALKLPAIFTVTEAAAAQFVRDTTPTSWELAQLSMCAFTGFRRRSCEREAREAHCGGLPSFVWPKRVLNRVVVTIEFGPGDWAMDVVSRFSVEGLDSISHHRLAGVVYGKGGSGLLARFVGPYGKLKERDPLSGTLASVLDSKGSVATWDTLTQEQRLVAHGKRARLAFYVLEPPEV